jgi:[histone H3]-lysine9 N-trimethyltransferase EHMT
MYSVLQKRAGSEMHLPNLYPENDSDAPPAPEYCIDGSSIGNFARFINHSCQPNLFVQCVMSSHNDVKLAKVMLFAADTILPLQVRSVGVLLLIEL